MTIKFNLYQIVREAAVLFKTVKINVPARTPRTEMLHMLRIMTVMLPDPVIGNALDDVDVYLLHNIVNSLFIKRA
jgi:hypothetical protein